MENITQQTEAAAIMEVITKETVAFWNKDFEAWSQCWLHTPQVRNMGWWKRGGVRVHRGWEAISQLIKTSWQRILNPTRLLAKYEEKTST
jgi:hypothetical protein